MDGQHFLDEKREANVHRPEQSQLLPLKTKFSCFHGRSSPEVDIGAVFPGCVLYAILINETGEVSCLLEF